MDMYDHLPGLPLAADVPVWLWICDLTERLSAWKAPTWPKPGSLRSSVCLCSYIFQVYPRACMCVFRNVSKPGAEAPVCGQLNEWAGDISRRWNVKRDNLMLTVLPSRPVLSRQQMACWHNKLYNGLTHSWHKRQKDRATSSYNHKEWS